jgi:hypothetical protein
MEQLTLVLFVICFVFSITALVVSLTNSNQVDPINSVLTGFVATPGTVTETDTVLTALEKLDANTPVAPDNFLQRNGVLPMVGNLNMGTGLNVINVGNITPLTDIQSDLASSGARFRNGFVNDITVGRVQFEDTNVKLGTATSGSGTNSAILGNFSSSGAEAAHVLGYNQTNSVAGSVLLEGSTNVRVNTDAQCDLGSDSNRFHDCFVAGQLQGPTGSLLLSASNTVTPIAPEPLCDFWQILGGLSFDGSFLVYNPHLDFVVANPPHMLAYSADFGETFTNCTFDISPSSFIITGNSPNLTVALDGSYAYTSTNSIDFTRHTPLGTGGVSFYVSFFNNLFITQQNVDSAHCIVVSPDAINWSAQATSDFTGYGFGIVLAQSESIIVASGNVADWSTDGTTWTNSPSFTMNNCQAMGYSADLHEFLAVSADGLVMISSDGKVWTDLGVIAPTSCANVVWVPTLGRWYIPRTYNGNYSVWTTPDPRKYAFVSSYMDGAISNLQTYSTLLYSEVKDRFVVGLNSVGVAYSTPRRSDIKAVSDTIRVRNAVVHTDQYSIYGNISVTNTLTETIISTSASSIGSLFYQAQIPVGMVIVFNFGLIASSTGGDTLTIRIKSTGLTTLDIPLTIPALSVNTPIQLVVRGSVRDSTMLFTVLSIVGSNPATLVNEKAFAGYSGNLFSATAQWSANVNTMTLKVLTMENLFRNGA